MNLPEIPVSWNIPCFTAFDICIQILYNFCILYYIICLMENSLLLQSQVRVEVPKLVVKNDTVGIAYGFADLSAVHVDAFAAFKDTMEKVIDEGAIDGKDAVDLILVASENHELAVEKEAFNKRMDAYRKGIERDKRHNSRRKAA